MSQVPVVTATLRDVAAHHVVAAFLIGQPIRSGGRPVAVELYVPATGRHTLANYEDVVPMNEEAQALLAYVPRSVAGVAA